MRSRAVNWKNLVKGTPPWKVLLLLVLLLILCRGILYRLCVRYHPIGEREVTAVTDPELIAEIDIHTDGKDLDWREIVRISRRITDRRLSFTTGESSNQANLVYRAGKANCVGYAALFAAIARHVAHEQQLALTVNHRIGKLTLLGWDLHGLFGNHPFFRDHDFVSVKGPGQQQYYHVDPSVSDYLGIRKVSSD